MKLSPMWLILLLAVVQPAWAITNDNSSPSYDKNPTNAAETSSKLPLLIKSVVPDNNTIRSSEPSGRIRGINNLCLDVTYDRYNDGNIITMWSCHLPNGEFVRAQTWVFKADGTIRSNEKCLTALRNIPGSNVVIYTCATAPAGSTIWEKLSDGTIRNKKSNLVLTAMDGTYRARVIVQENRYAPQQGWLAGSDILPKTNSIVAVGIGYRCLRQDGEDIWLDRSNLGLCNSNNIKQAWDLYPDGTIRPKQNTATCITCSDAPGTILANRLCSPGSQGQRWMYNKDDRTIMNVRNKLVMEVRNSRPDPWNIITAAPTGKENQKWLPA